MPTFVTCPSCQCAVKSSERACPHCGATFAGVGHVKTAAAILLGLATVAVGCGDDTSSGGASAGGGGASVDGGGGSGGEPASFYGVAGSPGTGGTTDGGGGSEGDGGFAADYGVAGSSGVGGSNR